MHKDQTALKESFHSINNLLNKITTQSGMLRYNLEEYGFSVDKLDEEKERIVKLLSDVEEYAMKIGEMLKGLHKIVTHLEKRDS